VKYHFFLGGRDAEMVRIAEVLTEVGVSFLDAALGWGAKASAYGTPQISETAANGFTPVIVELEVDCDLPEGTVVVDHHGDRSSEPASLLQVLTLIGREPSRWDVVVAANDSGWFPGLQAVSATPEEMSAVRAADRAAQGITTEQEQEIDRALAAPVEMLANIRIVRMEHSKTGGVGDRLAIEAIAAGRSIPAYLVLSGDGEVNFSGQGDIAKALHEEFSGSWAGGAGLGKADGTAYWGAVVYPSQDEVLEFLRERVADKKKTVVRITRHELDGDRRASLKVVYGDDVNIVTRDITYGDDPVAAVKALITSVEADGGKVAAVEAQGPFPVLSKLVEGRRELGVAIIRAQFERGPDGRQVVVGKDEKGRDLFRFSHYEELERIEFQTRRL